MIEEHKIKYKGVKGVPVLTEAKAKNTGSWRVFKPRWLKEKCIKCRRCWLLCPENAIKLDKEGYPVIDYDICKGCGICAKNCPVKAIVMERDYHEKG